MYTPFIIVSNVDKWTKVNFPFIHRGLDCATSFLGFFNKWTFDVQVDFFKVCFQMDKITLYKPYTLV